MPVSFKAGDTFYVIYKVTNKITGRFYIGKHKTKNPGDWYYGSSPTLQEDIKRLGKENFKKEILFCYKRESTMIRKEKELVNLELIRNPMSYNYRLGG